MTTGKVAEILEDKYGIMEYFWDNHHDEIIDILGEHVQGAFETTMMGGPTQANIIQNASSEIEVLFQQFIIAKEMDGKVAGVPTAASLKGVSKRFKKGKKASAIGRPSFFDTGLYMSSFRAWGE